MNRCNFFGSLICATVIMGTAQAAEFQPGFYAVGSAGQTTFVSSTNTSSSLASNSYMFSLGYEFKLNNNEPKKDFVDEYLIFVITKRDLKWMDEYPYDDFRARLREIPGDEKRTIKRAYRIFK